MIPIKQPTSTVVAFKVLAFWFTALLLPLSQLPAQMGGGDPSEEIKEIAASIDKQLKEIDELLRESGRKGQQRSKPKELLEKAAESSLSVQDGIEKLIEKLNEMKNQGSSSQQGSESQDQGGQSQPQDGQQSPQQQGQSGKQRRENQTPDFVQQPSEGEQQGEGQKPKGEQGQQEGQEGQKPEQQPGGQQPQDQQGDGDPKGGKQSNDAGENRTGKQPPNSETGPGQPGTGEGEWGGLQPYLNFLRNRGASPKVPEKFRKYHEAYLKNKQKGKK